MHVCCFTFGYVIPSVLLWRDWFIPAACVRSTASKPSTRWHRCCRFGLQEALQPELLGNMFCLYFPLFPFTQPLIFLSSSFQPLPPCFLGCVCVRAGVGVTVNHLSKWNIPLWPEEKMMKTRVKRLTFIYVMTRAHRLSHSWAARPMASHVNKAVHWKTHNKAECDVSSTQWPVWSHYH